jgi:hypothetical protein
MNQTLAFGATLESGCGMAKPDQEETYSEAETDARREAALKRMLATPHKPHKESKRGRDANTR